MNLNKIIFLLISSISILFSQCDTCENDYTNYGSQCCDTAWEEYGLNCADLQANYDWDCSGCACPGDAGGGDNSGGCWQNNPLTGDLEWYDDCDGGWDIDIPGCTDESANNYNSNANLDDGSCNYGNDGTPCNETECGSYLEEGYSCEELIQYGYDCSSCEEECGSNDGEVCVDDEDCSGYVWNIVYFKPDTTWSSSNPGHFLGLQFSEDLWGYPSFETPKLYESFADYNANGICDNEPFTDRDGSDSNQNGICDETGDWTSRCEEDANDCINAVVIQSGYKASNITFPADTPEIDFIVPDANNKGNGQRLYNIVNEYELTDAILRFEINAGLDTTSFGDSAGSFATLNPSLYIYEIISSSNINPINIGDIHIVEGMDEDTLEYYLGFPGAKYNSENTEIILPEYKLRDYKLTYIDDPLFESHYTDWFDGIQFRFDNGPNKINDVLSLVEIKEFEYSDTLLKDYLTIKMKYNAASDIAKRPMYRYRIDFSTSIADTAAYGTGRNCEQYIGYPINSHTFYPLKSQISQIIKLSL